MDKAKIFRWLFYLILVISLVWSFTIANKLYNLINIKEGFETIYNQYNSLQKTIGILGIVSFIVLLSISLVLYYLCNSRNYIFLSNLVYIGIILFVFITINKQYYINQNLDYTQQSTYWLTVIMGIFYIIGAILVSAIGYITLRNYINRSRHPFNKGTAKL